MNKRIKVVMNERTTELAKLAQMRAEWMTPQGLEWFDNFKEQFTELIVRECLKQIKDGMVDESELLYEHEETTECVNEALMDAHHNIAIHFGFAKHFGIEE